MADKKDNIEEEKPNLEKILDKSTEKATAIVDKDILIEKQNIEMKRLLRLLPFQIFLLVADADGKIDPKEVAQFKEFLNQRERRCSNTYTRRMFHATVVNYTALTNRFLGGHIKKDFTIVEKVMNYVQLCVPFKTMSEICQDLRELAVAIAEASGGFLGVTSPISKEEDEVLKKLDEIFDRALASTDSPETPIQMAFDI